MPHLDVRQALGQHVTLSIQIVHSSIGHVRTCTEQRHAHVTALTNPAFPVGVQHGYGFWKSTALEAQRHSTAGGAHVQERPASNIINDHHRLRDSEHTPLTLESSVGINKLAVRRRHRRGCGAYPVATRVFEVCSFRTSCYCPGRILDSARVLSINAVNSRKSVSTTMEAAL
jgi:hypothetical protein